MIRVFAMASSGSDVQVLGTWASPFVMRARIALNLKSVNYDFLEETFGTKSQLLLQSNPIHKKMPVLIHRGKPLPESLIIIQYIDDVWASSGTAILPADPYDRAIARFWASYLDDKWYPAFRAAPRAQGEFKKMAIEQVMAGPELLEEAFEKCSKGKSFFGGDNIGYLDIALGSFLGWIEVSDKTSGVKILDPEKTPLLVGWAKRFCEADAVKGVMPDTDKLMEFSKKLAAKYGANNN